MRFVAASGVGEKTAASALTATSVVDTLANMASTRASVVCNRAECGNHGLRNTSPYQVVAAAVVPLSPEISMLCLLARILGGVFCH